MTQNDEQHSIALHLNAIADSIALGNRKSSLKQGNDMAGKKNEQSEAVGMARTVPDDAPNGDSGFLQSVRNVKDITDEIGAGEYMKKPDVVKAGAFNIVGVAGPRHSTYNGRPQSQYTFELQFLDGKIRGARAYCSFETNIVRDKLAAAVRRYGGVGPFTLEQNENDAYIFVNPDLVDAEPKKDGE